METLAEQSCEQPSVQRLGLVATLACGLAALSMAGISRSATAANNAVRIGVQKTATLVILRERRILAPVLARLGWSVVWTEFPAGP